MQHLHAGPGVAHRPGRHAKREQWQRAVHANRDPLRQEVCAKRVVLRGGYVRVVGLQVRNARWGDRRVVNASLAAGPGENAKAVVDESKNPGYSFMPVLREKTIA